MNTEFALLEVDDRVMMTDFYIGNHGGPRQTGVVVGYRQWKGSTFVKIRHTSDGSVELYAPHVWRRISDGKIGRAVESYDSVPFAAKAIETTYSGHRFRSRTEARWAIVFDVLNLTWEYELEGINLPSGKYLPDFYLPQVKMHAEVKPGTFSPLETQKCHELADATGCACLMLDGPPDAKAYYAALPSEDPAGVVQELALFTLTNRKGCITNHGKLWSAESGDIAFEDTEYAVSVARSARFEHGESGPLVVRVEVPVKTGAP